MQSALTQSASLRCAPARCAPVCCAAKASKKDVNFPSAAVAALMSVAMTTGPMIEPTPAVAMSYQERMAERQARKQMLTDSLREAEEGGAEEAPEETAQSRMLASMKSSLSIKIPDVPAAIEESVPEPPKNFFSAPAPPVEAPAPKLFSFSSPTPPSPPAPIEVPKIELPKIELPKVEVPKVEVPEVIEEAAPASNPFAFWMKKAPMPQAPPPVPEPVAPSPPPPPPVMEQSEPAAPTVNWWEKLSEPTPAPVKVPEVKAPEIKVPEIKAPVKVPEPAKVVEKVEAKKEEVKEAVSTKRKGPLPLFIGQFVLVGIYGALGYALLVKSDEVEKAYAAAGKAALDYLKD